MTKAMARMGHGALWFVAIMVLVSGCQPEVTHKPATSPAGWPGATWQIGETLLELGAPETASGPFYRIVSAKRLRNGNVAVAQAADPVQIYNERGHMVASFGRSGEGPAEFMRVDRVWQGHGDTIWVGEAVRGRTVAFSQAGVFLLSVPLAAVVRGFQWAVVGPAAGDGLILEEVTAGKRDARGLSESPRKVWYLYDQATGELTRLAEGVAREVYVHSWSGSVAEGEIIFGGRSHAWLWGTGIGLAPAGHELQAIRLDSEATPVARFVNGYLAPSPTRDDRQQYITWRLLNAPGNADTAAWRRALDESPEPDRMPAVAAGIVDSEGALWIRQYSPPFETEAVWYVFGPDGTWFGQIALPNNLTVTEIGSDFILGFARDELKVETVVLLELRRFQ